MAIVRPSWVERPVAQHRGDDAEAVLEARESIVERDVVARELDLVPAGADAEDDATATHLVERLGHLREEGRVAEGEGQDVRAELDPGRGRRERGQQRPRLPGAAPVAVGITEADVVRHPDGIEADGLGAVRHRPDVRPARGAAVHRSLDVREVEAELDPCHGVEP